MQLSKLYSNQESFKNIKFNLNGLNVIYAEVKSEEKEKKNSHDLGKTKFAEIIDFLLLKEINKDHFLLKIKDKSKSIFEDFEFYLELYLNSGKYLTIRRGVAENTKISFSISDSSTQEFTPPTEWFEEKLAIKKSKELLERLIAFDFFSNKPYGYRKAISYSLRRQDDFKDVYKLNKFSRGADIDWKPFMFDLLGFDGNLLRLKYQSDNQIDDIKSYVKKLKNEFSVNVDERDTIVAEKQFIESDYAEIEEKIDRFNFYEKDKELIKNGVEEIENRINDLNSSSYLLNFEIDKLNSSIGKKFQFNIKKVKKVFDETELYFPDALAADYTELQKFNKKITSERDKLLKETLKKKEEELQNINSELEELNKERETLLSTLTDSDTFTKFKSYQKDLVKVEGKLLKFQEKIDTIDKIIGKEEEIEELQLQIKATTEKVKSLFQKTSENNRYNEIRASFRRFYQTIMDENAILSWKLNGEGNVDFIPPKVTSKLMEDVATAKDEGNTYMKLLCVAFDLALISSYNKESYYRFVYHDDVLSQQDNGIKHRLLELINKQFKKVNYQYILSVIKSDLPTNEENNLEEFADEEIVLKLHDKDASGTLFGFEF